MLNPLLEGLRRKVEKNKSEIVLTDCKTGKNISAISFWKEIHEIAANLKNLNVTAGSHVVVTLPLGEQFCKIIYATLIIDAVPVFLDPGMKADHLSKCVEQIDPAIWISHESFINFKITHPDKVTLHSSCPSNEIAKKLPDIKEDKPCMMLYTSGTTGLPKGVPWTHTQLKSHIDHQESYYKNHQIKSEFAIFPHLAIIAISTKKRCVIPNLDNLQPVQVDMQAAYDQMATYGCDYVFASPLFWQRMLEFCEPRGLTIPQIKVATTAGSALNKEMLSKLSQILPNGKIFIPYASTEVIMPISNIGLDEMLDLSINGIANCKGIPLGIPANDTRIKIVNSTTSFKSTITQKDFLPTGKIGEIVVSSPRVTFEYFKRPDLNLETKLRESENDRLWHKMGDIGYLDENGMLWFLSRKKYVYQTKLGVIYPDQQEQFYNHHLGIYESAIVFNPLTEHISLIIPQYLAQPGQAGKACKLANLYHLQLPKLSYFPGRLPSDPRHNSKINRDELLEWLQCDKNLQKPDTPQHQTNQND